MTASPGLLMAGAALLILCAISGVLLVQGQEQTSKLRRRIASVVPQEKKEAERVTLFTSRADQRGRVIDQITGIMGFNISKADQYPMPWWSFVLIAWLGACCLAYILTSVLGDIVTAFLPVIFVVVSRLLFGFFKSRRQDKLFRQFPDALAMVVRSVRVGIPVSEAIRAVAREAPLPTGPEFARLAEEISIGVPLDEALHGMAERNDMAEYRFFATALTLQAQTGGTLSETLENLADVIRKRVALRERGNALASEAKTSAMVLGCLPIAAGLGLWLLNPQYLSILFTDKGGHMVLGGCATLLTLGVLTMRTIIKKSLQ